MGQAQSVGPSCEQNKFVLNLNSGVVHPCNCDTIHTLRFPNASYLGFDSFKAAHEYAQALKLSGHIPNRCSSSHTQLSSQFTEETALEILQRSQSSGGGHPGDHIPLKNESEAQMLAKARDRGKAKTTFYTNINDAKEDLAYILNNNSERLKELIPGGTLDIKPENPLTKSELKKTRTIKSYSLNRDRRGEPPLRDAEANQATVIVRKTSDGFLIVTFYPMD